MRLYKSLQELERANRAVGHFFFDSHDEERILTLHHGRILISTMVQEHSDYTITIYYSVYLAQSDGRIKHLEFVREGGRKRAVDLADEFANAPMCKRCEHPLGPDGQLHPALSTGVRGCYGLTGNSYQPQHEPA